MALSPKLEEIVESVARDRAALLRSVEGLDAAQLDHVPEPGAWCVADVLHHLALTAEASEKLFARMQQKALESPPPADLRPEASLVDAIDAVVRGADEEKAQAPDRVQPRSRIAAQEAVARLEKAQAGLVDKVESLAPYDLSGLTFPHPFFGELDLYQWILIGGWHERRHTRQIERIKSSPGFPR